MPRVLPIWLCATALVACSGDDAASLEPNNITVVTPTRPEGFVAGLFEDAISGAPLEGVGVLVVGGGVTGEAVTDAGGTFEIGPIAAGASFLVRASLDGYVAFEMSGVQIDDAAGDFPTANGSVFLGPIALLPSTGSFDVDVVGPDGRPLAMVGVSATVRPAYFSAGSARDSNVYLATTDSQGRASFSGTADLARLPLDRQGEGRIDIAVGPVDADGDGGADFAGTTARLDADDVRAGRRRRLLVLAPVGADDPLELVATNLRGVIDRRTGPSVVSASDGVRLLFNRSVAVDRATVDVVDETGERSVSATAMAGEIDGLVSVVVASPDAGQEYNLDVTVPAAFGSDRVRVRKPFFVEEMGSQSVSVLGRYEDRDETSSWGTGNDALRLETSLPLGRADGNAFRAELWIELDLDGSGMIGDATGELPVAASQYPNPILLGSAEPSPANGAGRSGYTTRLAPRTVRLSAPLEDGNAVVNFEVRFPAARNDGQAVTTPSGRMAPPSFTGSATLVGPPA